MEWCFLEGAKAVERYYIPKQHLYYLSLLLHDALLQEKYVQAAYIMIAISQNPQTLPEQIWRVSDFWNSFKL